VLAFRTVTYCTENEETPQSVARELGVSEADVAKGAEALVPAILGGVKKQVQSQGVGSVGWLMGLEPTTTGITILDSTN
jgi:hypothetical protein